MKHTLIHSIYGKDRRLEWPNDLAGHVTYHRVKDIEQALAERK